MTEQARELIEYYNMISLSINSKEKMIAKLQTEIDCLRETKGSITNILAKGGYRLNPSVWTEKTQAQKFAEEARKEEVRDIREDFGEEFMGIVAKELGKHS